MATKQHYGTSGIYQITNTVNGKFYIGSSNNVGKRLSWHKCSLEKGTHNNPHLQASANKYGVDKFKFELILECPVDYLFAYEQQHFNDLRPHYNILPIAGSPQGIKLSEETKEKMSKAHTGRKHSLEHNKRVSETRLALGHTFSRTAIDNSAKVRTKQIIVWLNELTPILFNSTKEVVEFFGLQDKAPKYVNSCCGGKHKLLGLKAEYA